MTPNEQRIAIAEACGLKVYVEWHAGNAFRDGLAITFPNYLTDLDACHEMEKVLTDEQRSVYCKLLLDAQAEPMRYWGTTRVAFATAAQRCEAFLRALKLWKP